MMAAKLADSTECATADLMAWRMVGSMVVGMAEKLAALQVGGTAVKSAVYSVAKSAVYLEPSKVDN